MTDKTQQAMPELPEPLKNMASWPNATMEGYYTADQMHAYALAAIAAASAATTTGVWRVLSDGFLRQVLAAIDSTDKLPYETWMRSYGEPISKATRVALSAAPQPQGKP